MSDALHPELTDDRVQCPSCKTWTTQDTVDAGVCCDEAEEARKDAMSETCSTCGFIGEPEAVDAHDCADREAGFPDAESEEAFMNAMDKD
jgi:hypothetical protein